VILLFFKKVSLINKLLILKEKINGGADFSKRI